MQQKVKLTKWPGGQVKAEYISQKLSKEGFRAFGWRYFMMVNSNCTRTVIVVTVMVVMISILEVISKVIGSSIDVRNHLPIASNSDGPAAYYAPHQHDCEESLWVLGIL